MDRFMQDLKVPALDVSSVSASFMTVCALCGESSTYTHIGVLPSAAGQLRCVIMGCAQLFAVRCHELLGFLKAEKSADGDIPVALKEAEDFLKTLDDENTMKQVVKVCKSFCRINVQDNSLVWIPTGYLVAERAHAGSLLRYGFRKSFFEMTHMAKEDLTAVIQMMCVA